MENKKTIIAFIFARGGSKGIPRKNLKLLAGKPLIAYSIEAGLQSKLISRVIVSTDDNEIAEVALRYGAEVPFIRPAEFAKDDTPEWLAWQHALREIGSESDIAIDLFVSLPPTSPLRAVEDIDNCIRMYFDNPGVDIILTAKNANRHPSFNMVSLDENGDVHLVMPVKKNIYRRQDASPVYDMTTVVYAARPDFIFNANSIFDGNAKMVLIPEERALDIDTEYDFKLAEFLITQTEHHQSK
jgi:CMP-N-acetylneuraminic acid synthetase